MNYDILLQKTVHMGVILVKFLRGGQSVVKLKIYKIGMKTRSFMLLHLPINKSVCIVIS